MISRISALTAAFAQMNGLLDPKTDAFQLCNPLLLKAFSPKHDRNEKGVRRFKSVPSGWDNGILDLKIKCSGQSFSAKHGLGPDSPLSQLVCIYGNPMSATRYIKNFLRAALNDDTISENTPLSWFLEEQTPEVTPELIEVTNGT